jgi:predicted acetyltransferase
LPLCQSFRIVADFVKTAIGSVKNKAIFCENYKHSAIKLAKEQNACLTSYKKSIKKISNSLPREVSKDRAPTSKKKRLSAW